MFDVLESEQLRAMVAEDRRSIERVLTAQHLQGMKQSALANFVVLTIVAAPFVGDIPMRILLLLIMPIYMASLEIGRFAFVSSRWLESDPDKVSRGAVIRAGLISLTWAVSIHYCLIRADDAARGMLGMLAAGLMAAGALACSNLPRAGVLFILTIGVSTTIAFLRIDVNANLLTVALTATFIITMLRHMFASYHAQIDGHINELRLQRSADTVALLLKDYEEQASDWLWQVDSLGHIVAPSNRFQDLVGGRNIEGSSLLSLFERRPETDQLARLVASGLAFRDLELPVASSGEERWWRLSGRPRRTASGKLLGMEGVATDITQTKASEARVTWMARHDALTGLPNRFMLNDAVTDALEWRTEHDSVALLYLDLDHFKMINDTLGHAAGDAVLQAISRLIEKTLHAGDLVARLGGDEFAVLLARDGGPARAVRTAQRIIEALQQPLTIDDTTVFSGTSIGIAFGPQDGTDAGELLRSADLALYEGKAAGRGCHMIYNSAMRHAMLERQSIEHDLRNALTFGEIELHYQPLITLETGEPTGYEALVRWNHPVRGLVMPAQFIPLAEDNGYIVQLGEWIIREALRELSRWPRHLKVAVNVSPVQLRTSALVATVTQALAATGVEPHRLELEVTESVLMHESEAALTTLHRLREIGVRIALDDFGTGYSSLNYLRSFPFDKIKIDRSFVTEIDGREDCQAIVRAVVDLATSLGMDTTAEGVESLEQLDQLRTKGVTEVQGYLFNQARSAADIDGLRKKTGAKAA